MSEANDVTNLEPEQPATRGTHPLARPVRTLEDMRAFWKLKKQQKKQKRREERSEIKAAQQAQWEALTPEEQETMRQRAVQVHEARRKQEEDLAVVCQERLACSSTPTLVFDLGFVSVMNDADSRSTMSQLKYSYSLLKRHGFLMKPVITSFSADHSVFGSLQSFEGFKRFPVPLSTNHWSEEFLAEKQQSRVVYLTADTDTILQDIEPNTVYIVGAFVDHNSKKGLTRDEALKHGARLARLPLVESIRVGNRCKVLTINHVVDVLIRFMETKDWVTAFECLPTRRINNASSDSSKREREGCDEDDDSDGSSSEGRDYVQS